MRALYGTILAAAIAVQAAATAAGVGPFPDGARVAFFGDSITRGGGGVLRVAAHYRKEFPGRDVRFYNVGISGGGVQAAEMYFERYLAAVKPTHVVLAFGVNDSGALRIDESAADARAETNRVEEAAAAFRKRYAALVGRIEALGAKIVLRIPTPYNEFGEGTATPVKGRNDSHRRVGDEIRAFASERGLPFVDDYARMSKSLAEGEAVISGDRIHPNDYGQWRMAESLLDMQGLRIEPFRPQGEVAADVGLEEWFAQSQKLADILSAEWLLVRDETLDVSAKLAKVREWLATKGAEPNANKWVVGLARRYLDDKPREDAIRADMEAAWDASRANACERAPKRMRPQYICYRSFRPQLEQTHDFAEMGIPLRCFFAANTINHGGSPYCDYPVIWKGFGKYDWAAFDAQVEDFLKVSPNAEFLCMIDLNTPYWATHRFWLDSFTDVTHAASDPKWIERTKEWMLDFIAYAEKKYGSRIRAYVLSGGGTSEWYEYDRGRTSRNKNAAWRKWCKGRKLDYGPSVPDQEKIFTASFENLVYDPATEADKIDYWRFHNSVVPDALLGFAAAAKKAVPAGREIGVFFGYYYVSDSKHCSFGHLGYERVFASLDIDFFIAPGNYSEREMGGGSGSQLVHSTARLYGKRLLHEIDFGPHTQKRWGAGIWKTAEDDMAGNTREAAFAIANGCSYWWFDMWGGENGFYDDPALRARIAKLAEVTRRYAGELPHPVDEVLLVADPDSIYYLNEKDKKERAFGQHFRNVLSKTGIPFDVCTLSDLKKRDISKTKVVVYPAAINVTPEKKALIESTMLTGGKTVVWCYAPGISDGKSLDTGRVKGFAGVPYATPGISTTKMDGWTSVYAHDYKLYTPESLRGIIAAAGAHVWTSKPAVVFANENFFAVHTKDGGDIEIALPCRFSRVTDSLTGETVAENADSFTCRFAAPDTRLFSIQR